MGYKIRVGTILPIITRPFVLYDRTYLPLIEQEPHVIPAFSLTKCRETYPLVILVIPAFASTSTFLAQRMPLNSQYTPKASPLIYCQPPDLSSVREDLSNPIQPHGHH